MTPLQEHALREIVALVRSDALPVNTHLTESQLVRRIGISRTPIQAALKHLGQAGLLKQDANRGYFLAKPAQQWTRFAQDVSRTPDDPLYLRIAKDRLSGELAEQISEAQLMRRYDVQPSSLKRVLARASSEGWAEQSAGKGWRFLAMMDSKSAYEESYRFRQAIEPAALQSPSYGIEAEKLAQLRAEQERIVAGGFKDMTAIELFEANSRFHESLVAMSGNRFMTQALERINQQRRLVEYSQDAHRGTRREQAQEHLLILEALESGKISQAAKLLHAHLDGARKAKLSDLLLIQ